MKKFTPSRKRWHLLRAWNQDRRAGRPRAGWGYPGLRSPSRRAISHVQIWQGGDTHCSVKKLGGIGMMKRFCSAITLLAILVLSVPVQSQPAPTPYVPPPIEPDANAIPGECYALWVSVEGQVHQDRTVCGAPGPDACFAIGHELYPVGTIECRLENPNLPFLVGCWSLHALETSGKWGVELNRLCGSEAESLCSQEGEALNWPAWTCRDSTAELPAPPPLPPELRSYPVTCHSLWKLVYDSSAGGGRWNYVENVCTWRSAEDCHTRADQLNIGNETECRPESSGHSVGANTPARGGGATTPPGACYTMLQYSGPGSLSLPWEFFCGANARSLCDTRADAKNKEWENFSGLHPSFSCREN